MLTPEATTAIVLGVSECPGAPNLDPLPHCANSARDFYQYLTSSLSIPGANILNLFDCDDGASDQIDQIDAWLASVMARKASGTISPTDLIFYYTGHGGFTRNDQAYFLATRKTRTGSEGGTSIRFVDLASSIKRHGSTLRRYLILDCCFAAAAVIRMSDIAQMVIQRVEDELPPWGTAMLCSSAKTLVSIAPHGEQYTMFSGALLECLQRGMPNGPPALSLEDVGNYTRKLIMNKYTSDSVRPELHVPEQASGNPATVPLFPNVLWRDKDVSAETVVAELSRSGIAVGKDDPRVLRVVEVANERKRMGYAYELAPASFVLLARRVVGRMPSYFDVQKFDVTVEQRDNERGQRVTVSLAVVKVDGVISASEGSDPINALDLALRKDLGKYQSYISGLELPNYRVVTINLATGTVTRVLIERQDETGDVWTTIGVAPNIIDAAFQALMDSVIYKLLKAGAA
jgi:LeuA allosteric (dimerisation) domain/Caspase domain